MRIIHTADCHLGSPLSAHYGPEAGAKRRAELSDTFVRITEYAKMQAVSAVLIAGDLFDRSSVDRSTVRRVLRAIGACPEVQYYYLRGNHDRKDPFSEETLPGNLHGFSDEWTSYPLDPEGKVVLSGVELASSDRSVYERLALDPEKMNLLLLHGQVRDAAGENDGESVMLRHLQHRGIDYLALGHIHEYREGRLDARGIYAYPGCPEGRGFDESGKKGFLLLDVDLESRRISRRFVPFARRVLQRAEVDITDARGTAEVVDRVREALKEDREGLAEAVLCGAYDAEEELDLHQLEIALEPCFYVFRVKDRTHFTVDYASYEHDASLKGEFIRLVKESALSEEDRAAVIRIGIQALRGEQIV